MPHHDPYWRQRLAERRAHYDQTTFDDDGWRVIVEIPYGAYCIYPRQPYELWAIDAYHNRDRNDAGPRSEPSKRSLRARAAASGRVVRRRHRYGMDTTLVSAQIPTELVIWLDQLTRHTPGGRRAILLPLIQAAKEWHDKGMLAELIGELPVVVEEGVTPEPRTINAMDVLDALRNGQRKEVELIALFNVERRELRRVCQRLQATGLIRTIPRRSTWIWAITDTGRTWLQTNEHSPA